MNIPKVYVLRLWIFIYVDTASNYVHYTFFNFKKHLDGIVPSCMPINHDHKVILHPKALSCMVCSKFTAVRLTSHTQKNVGRKERKNKMYVSTRKHDCTP